MEQNVSKNTALEEWAVANEKYAKEWAVQKTKEYYKNGITSNSIWLSVFILVTIGFCLCLVQAIVSYGGKGVGLLLILGLIEAFYLVTGMAFKLPSMLKRCIVRYQEIEKGNCHAVIARCLEISPTGENGWHDAVYQGIHGENVGTLSVYISDDMIALHLETLFCLVYVEERCIRRYNLEEARRELPFRL